MNRLSNVEAVKHAYKAITPRCNPTLQIGAHIDLVGEGYPVIIRKLREK